MAHNLLKLTLRRWAKIGHLARIAVIYIAARILTTAIMLAAAGVSGPGSRFGAEANLGSFVVGWDAQWYWLVAENGYPSVLPMTDSGAVAENAWAFMPLFPYLAQGIGWVLGSWGAGALLISVLAGYGACLALFRLLQPRIGRNAATWAVAFFAAGPIAAMFQVGYAESLFLFLLLLALEAVARRRYAWLYLLVPVAGFTRPGILAFALFLGLHGIYRWVRRRTDPLRTVEIVHILLTGALAVAVGFSWQVIAALVTGDPGAYMATELAWRRHWGVHESGFVPVDGWVQAAQFWFTFWGMPAGWGIAALILLVVGFAATVLFLPSVRKLGVDLRLWSASYALYLLAVFFPQSSTFRLLLPLSPLWGAVAVPRNRVYRIAVLVACILGQWGWIHSMYAFGNAFWQVP